MEKMTIYEQVKTCPQNALKPIMAGRLKGKSDINPMWRIKALTELFGACGIGWYYEIDRQWTEQGANGEIAAYCNISLYIKQGENWSKPIKGTGGSMFVASERNGLYTSDECYKMALTDAISVACKALGFAADVYWQADCTKYDQMREQPTQQRQQAQQPAPQQPTERKISATGAKALESLIMQAKANREDILRQAGVVSINDLTAQQGKELYEMLKERVQK